MSFAPNGGIPSGLGGGALGSLSALGGLAGPVASGQSGTVRVDDDGMDTISTTVNAQGLGYLVVADADQVGWTATLDGKNPNGWLPEQKLSVAEAVEAYTMGSAYAEFQEKEKGSITPGKLADMVILSDDIFSIDPKLIRDVQVETTIMDGKVVWQKASTAQ